MRVGPFVFFFVVFSVVLAAAAFAHEAAKGWSYPYNCCHDQDCRPIDAATIREIKSGWLVPSGEVVAFSDPRIKVSPDGDWHWCSKNGSASGRTICLFVPPRLF